MPKKHRGYQKRKAGVCAVKTCSRSANYFHHYLPFSQFGDNPFVIQLCNKHHKEADELVVGKYLTAQKCFTLTYNFIRGGD